MPLDRKDALWRRFGAFAVGAVFYWLSTLIGLVLIVPSTSGDPGFLLAPSTFLLLGVVAAPGEFVAQGRYTPLLLGLPVGGLGLLVLSVVLLRFGWLVSALGFGVIGAGGATILLTGYF